MEYGSGIKSQATQAELKGAVLRERGQSQKTTQCMILLMCHSGKGKSRVTKNRPVVVGAVGETRLQTAGRCPVGQGNCWVSCSWWWWGRFTQICTCVETHRTGHHRKLIRGEDGEVKLPTAPRVGSGQAGPNRQPSGRVRLLKDFVSAGLRAVRPGIWISGALCGILSLPIVPIVQVEEASWQFMAVFSSAFRLEGQSGGLTRALFFGFSLYPNRLDQPGVLT